MEMITKQLQRHIKSLHADSFQRNAVYLMINSVMCSILGFIFWIIAAKYYTPSEIGLASTLISTSTLLSVVANLGLGIGIIKYLPPLKKNSNNLINSFTTVAGSTSVIVSIIFLGLIRIFSQEMDFLNNSYLYQLMFIVVTLCFVIGSIQESVFVAERKSGYSILKNLIMGSRFLYPAFFVTFGTIGIFSSYGIAYILSILVTTFFLLPHAIKGYIPKIHVDKLLIKDSLNYSIGNYIAGFFELAPGLMLPFIITNMISSESTAYFYIAWTVSSVLYIIPKSIATSLFAEGSNGKEKFNQEIKKSLKLVSILLLPAIVVVFIAGDKILFAFGESYSKNSIELLRILVISSLPLAVNTIIISIWRVKKRINNIIITNASIAIATIIIGYLMAPYIGVTGFGLAWLFSQIIITTLISRKYIFNFFLSHKTSNQ